MLRIIMGRSGSGKTRYVQNMLSAFAKKSDEKLMMIVPEQLSFETEKSFLNLLGPKESRRIEVLSFSRMVDFVFQKTGGLSGRVIDDGGRSIIMSLAVEAAQDNLDLYKRQVNRPEFTDLMLTAVKEFKMCSITTESLRSAAAKTDNTTLKQKLNETAIITDIYNAMLCQSYIDPLDNLTKLYETLLENNIFHDYTVVVDSFSGFTVQEQKILEQIFKQSKNCCVTLCTDKEEFAESSRRFNTTNATKKLITRIAKKAGVKVAAPFYLTENQRAKTESLKALESEIFKISNKSFDIEPKGIKLYSALDIYSECDFAAREIKKLTAEDEYRFRDIAVICRSAEKYTGILDTIFEKYDIDYFMDKPVDIDSKPLITFVFSAFDIIHSSFATQNILRMLKSGLTELDAEDISNVENYTYVWNISGKRWCSTFTANPAGYSDEFSDDDKILLEKIESVRRKIILPLVKFKNSINDSSGKGICFAVYKLIEDYNIENIIKNHALSLREKGLPEQAKEQIRIWDMFMSVLDRMALILNDKYINSKRFAELLRTFVISQDISFIPQGIDQVIVGTADRVRLNSPKAVFLIGAAEGEFPSVPVSAGIFSDLERKQLISMDIPMYDSLEDLAAMEQFYAYCGVSAPSEKLYISYYEATLSGELKTPSSLITEVKSILPQIEIIYEKEENPYDNLWCKEQAFEFLSRNWKDENPNNTVLKDYLKRDEKFKGMAESLDILSSDKPAEIEDKQLSKRLFGSSMRLSASQVEKFYLCSFQYFCRYGLKTKERKRASIDSAEYGSLIHYILERLLKNNSVKYLSGLSDKQLNDIIKKEMEEYLNNHLGGGEDKSVRFLLSYKRTQDAALTVISHIIKELSQSRFTPADFELNIGGDIEPYSLALSDGTNLVIQGYVDRVDILKEDNKAYIRIIDYKTGSKKFMLSDVMFGLNLQMLIYLSAIVKNGGKRYNSDILPAGVLYMPSGEASVTFDGAVTAQEIDDSRNKNFKMNGLLLNDIDIIRAMEREGKGVYIPVTLKEEKPKKKKDGTNPSDAPVIKIGKGSEYVVSAAQMQNIFDKIDELISDMAVKLLQGKIAAVPAKGNYDACKWCPYINICGYKEGMECREIKKSKSAFNKENNMDED